MKLVRVSYTVLHSFEVPDDYTDYEMQFMIEGFAEENGFLSICNDIDATVTDVNGKVDDIFLER